MLAPLCRYCGGPIKKTTRTVYLRDRPLQSHERESVYSRYIVVEKLPATIDECRKLTNHQVVSVKRHHDAERNAITFFSEWDGESYEDKFFCNGDHAKRFAYVMAGVGRVTVDYAKALAAQTAKV